VEFVNTGFEGLYLIKPKVFGDNRGYFFESYNADVFRKNGIEPRFVQDNQSMSHKGALRGLHFQAPPFAQGKLVRVVRGSVWDVVLDIRKSSPTYGKHFTVEISEENNHILWIPEGFAHGFLTLEDNTIFCYKCTGLYNKESEGGVLWNDPDLGINWGITDPILSEKDKQNVVFKNLESPFA
jgi:dTDP-4-dehydrorhamnose 3,5-epimerase